jgi:hypothetical protein
LAVVAGFLAALFLAGGFLFAGCFLAVVFLAVVLARRGLATLVDDDRGKRSSPGLVHQKYPLRRPAKSANGAYFHAARRRCFLMVSSLGKMVTSPPRVER